MDEEVINEIKCFAKTDKGCKGLDYGISDLTFERCNNCKFRKSVEDLVEQMLLKRHSRLKGFNLMFDNENKGFFSSIKEIDKWLKDYFMEHKEFELTRYNRGSLVKDRLFNDYNVLFYNHNIRFQYV